MELVNGVQEEEFVNDMFSNLSAMFPALKSVEFDGINCDVLNFDGPHVPNVYGLVTLLRVRKCSRVLELANLMPNLAELCLNYIPLSLCSSPRFENLVRLRIDRDNYRDRMDFKDLKDLLQACVKITELYLNKVG